MDKDKTPQSIDDAAPKTDEEVARKLDTEQLDQASGGFVGGPPRPIH